MVKVLRQLDGKLPRRKARFRNGGKHTRTSASSAEPTIAGVGRYVMLVLVLVLVLAVLPVAMMLHRHHNLPNMSSKALTLRLFQHHRLPTLSPTRSTPAEAIVFKPAPRLPARPVPAPAAAAAAAVPPPPPPQHPPKAAPPPVTAPVQRQAAPTLPQAAPPQAQMALLAGHPLVLPARLAGRIPFFLHFHKAGGTTLCHYARTVNHANAPIRNCNLPGDGPRTLTEGLAGDFNSKMTCTQRLRYARTHCINFMACERWLDDALCPHLFLYVTVLRDPIKRIESNCRFENVQPAAALQWTTTTHLPFERVTVGTASVDNFYVRSLCGHDVFHLPAGAITREHLEMAKTRLARFEVIMVLEEMDAGMAQLQQGSLAWAKPASPKDSHRSFGKGNEQLRFSTEQLEEMRRRNSLDVELYEFALERSRRLTEFVLSPSHNHTLPPPPASGEEAALLRELPLSKRECSRKFDAWSKQQAKEKQAQLKRESERRRQSERDRLGG